MVVSETVGFITVFGLTIVFTAFAFMLNKGVWHVLLKFIAGLFWMIFGISIFRFMGADGFLMVLGLPFVVIGMIFWFMLLHDFLDEKRKRPFEFDD